MRSKSRVLFKSKIMLKDKRNREGLIKIYIRELPAEWAVKDRFAF